MNDKKVRASALRLSIDYCKTAQSPDLCEILSTAEKFAEYINQGAIDNIETQPVFEWSKDELEDLTRCVSDPIHFGRKCFSPNELYDHQVDFFNHIHFNNRSVTVTARQMGISTASAIYALWYASMNPDRTIGVLTSKAGSVTSYIDLVRTMQDRLPEKFKTRIISMTDTDISFENGSYITVQAATEYSFRGMALSLLMIQDAAFISHGVGNRLWRNLAPALGHTKIIMYSTPSNCDGFFYHTYFGTMQGGTKFACLDLPCDLHPLYNKTWSNEIRKSIGDEKYSQEYECRFV